MTLSEGTRQPDNAEVEEPEEEEDVDFNPLLIASSPISEASSSLSSEDELSRPTKRLRASPEPDSICHRTRARHSLADHTLEELEAFLQESDDDDPLLLNRVDDQEEYRKFLAAVLGTDEAQDDDEEEENDADFEIEIGEALESDEEAEIVEVGTGSDHDERRRETRQKKSQKSRDKPIGIGCSSLRPILPFSAKAAAVAPPPLAGAYPLFTASQIGQLHCLIQEHVQLLIQIFSLCVLDPSKHYIAEEVKGLILKMVESRETSTATRKDAVAAYPASCFDNLQDHRSEKNSSWCLDFPSWTPMVNHPVWSVLDVTGLGLAREYLDDVSVAVSEYRGCQVDGVSGRNQCTKAPLFPLANGASNDDPNCEAMEGNMACQDAVASPPDSSNKPRKSLAAVLVENTKKQSIALVPRCIVDLAQRFVPIFNSAMFPRKPPIPSVANRILFTDSEDGLLAMGLMEYNTDWGKIRQRYLPCKSKHQIFVRQKNRSSSKAPENPIKAVRRMKASPLTANEMVLISKGLKVYKNDWNAVWQVFVPYRDPSLLPRQYRIANGTQKSYKKSEVVKEKRRAYEAKRRRRKSSLNQHTTIEKVNDNEHNFADDNLNGVNEAFLAVSKPESSKTLSIINQARVMPKVVKFPGLPPVKLPASVHVIPQSAFKSYHRTPCSQDRSRDFSVGLRFSGETGNENSGSKYIHPSDHMPNHGSRVNAHLIEESHHGPEFMNPLLFQVPDDGYPDYYSNGGSITSNTLNFLSASQPQHNPSIHVNEQSGRFVELSQSILCSNENAPHGHTIDFHPLLQRSENVSSSLYINFANRSQPDSSTPIQKRSYSFNASDKIACESQIDQGHPVNAVASSLHERENDLDLDIHLYSSTNKKGNDVAVRKNTMVNHISNTGSKMAVRTQVASPSITGKDHHTTSVTQPNMNSTICGKSCVDGVIKVAVPRDTCKSTINETEDEFLTEIVMEREELSDTDDDIENVEFECEEMDDSGDDLGTEHPPDITHKQPTSNFPGRVQIHSPSSNEGMNSVPANHLNAVGSPSSNLKPKKKAIHRGRSLRGAQTAALSDDNLSRKRNAKGPKVCPSKRPEPKQGATTDCTTGASRKHRRDGC